MERMKVYHVGSDAPLGAIDSPAHEKDAVVVLVDRTDNRQTVTACDGGDAVRGRSQDKFPVVSTAPPQTAIAIAIPRPILSGLGGDQHRCRPTHPKRQRDHEKRMRESREPLS